MFLILEICLASQLIIQKVENVDFTEVKNLEDTDRGDGGFGSTGR